MPRSLLCLALEVEGMVDAGGEFFLIVGDEDKGNGWILTVFIYQALYHAAIVEVETMEGFVENQQVGLFHESTGEKYQALLATRHLQELTIG